jgi:hypothetical protein
LSWTRSGFCRRLYSVVAARLTQGRFCLLVTAWV